MGHTPDVGDRDTLVDAVDADAGMLLGLPTVTYPEGATVLNTEAFQGYLIIITGSAAEYAISRDGQPIADRIDLVSKDVIGLGNYVRVEALTDLTVAVVSEEVLAKATPRLKAKLADFLLEAARKRNTDTRNRLIERDATVAEQSSVIEVLEGSDSQRLELEAKLNAKRADLENALIDNARIARRFTTVTRELDHKSKEVLSAATILQLYKEEIDETEETLQARTKELSELRTELASLSGLAPVLERMISSDNADWAKVAQKALTLLYAEGKGRKH